MIQGPREPVDPSGPPDLAPLTDAEFGRIRELVYREAGIHLAPVKKALVVARLARRLRELGLRSFGAYHARVLADATGDELVRLLDAITTNETHFFREPHHFDLLQRRVFPEWLAEAAAGERPRTVRVWSAGCSTGEEPATLAMVLLDRFPPESGWSVSVLATDLSTRALARARSATWPIERAGEIPERYLKRFMLRGTGSQHGKMKAGPAVRGAIRYERANLVDPGLAVPGPFDLVFCRNVLIYFDAGSRATVHARLLARLHPRGYLFLGHAESLSARPAGLECVVPTVYASRDRR